MYLQPWIGKHYNKGIKGHRILLCGESHYFDEEFDNSQKTTDLTPKVVEDVLQKKEIH